MVLMVGMDNILFFGGGSDDSQEDLPWGKDWVKSAQDPKEPQEVISCYLGDKGILLETGNYKTFIFKKEKIHGHLKQALFVWVEGNKSTKPLIVAYMNKRFCYGLNQSKPDVRWFRDENKFTSQRVDDSPVRIKGQVSNPFLPSDNPTLEAPSDRLVPPQSENARKRKTAKEGLPEDPATPLET